MLIRGSFEKRNGKKHRKTKFPILMFCCFQAVLVHTQETIRVRYFMDLLMENRRPIMLVGSAGTGKTVLVGDKFAAMDPDNVMVTNVPFNYYTTSAMLQSVLDKPLEKKAGRNYGPPGTKKLIYFIDDMNMPMVSPALAASLFLQAQPAVRPNFSSALVFSFRVSAGNG